MQTYLGDHTVEVTRHDVDLMQIIVTSTYSENHPHTLDCIYEECEVGFDIPQSFILCDYDLYPSTPHSSPGDFISSMQSICEHA